MAAGASPAFGQTTDLLAPANVPRDVSAHQVDAATTLPRALEVVRAGIDEGLHVGAQWYVSLGREVFADAALGWARPGVPMTPDTLMIWFSSTKPVTAVAIAQLWERNQLRLDDPVAEYIPEFGQNGKDRITLRQVLTHTGCFARALETRLDIPGPEAARALAEATLDEDCTPGRTAQYHPLSGWYVLGGVLSRVARKGFPRYLRDEVFAPLGLLHCWIGMPPQRYDAYGELIGHMHNTDTGTPEADPVFDSREACALAVPGGNGRGPMRQLGQFYEALMEGGELDGVRVLREPTVEAMVSPHRLGTKTPVGDEAAPWGLGIALDELRFGGHTSVRTFGHSGSRSSMAFCDPVHKLVVAVVFNGRPVPANDARRMFAFSNAIYEDLGLASPDTWRADKAEQITP